MLLTSSYVFSTNHVARSIAKVLYFNLSHKSKTKNELYIRLYECLIHECTKNTQWSIILLYNNTMSMYNALTHDVEWSMKKDWMIDEKRLNDRWKKIEWSMKKDWMMKWKWHVLDSGNMLISCKNS